MEDYDSIRKLSRGKFTSAQFIKLKELAKNTIGVSNDIYEIKLKTLLELHSNLEKQINKLEVKIENISKELNPPTLSVKEIGIASCVGIRAEFDDISRFKSADAMVTFAGLEPSISQFGTEFHTEKMVNGLGHLRYYLMNVAEYVMMHDPIFTEYYYKNRNEGKCHRVVCSHIAKKLIRIIYKLETENITFDSSKCI